MLSTIALLLVVTATLCWMALAWLVRMPAARWPFITTWGLGVAVGALALTRGPGNGMAVTAVIVGTLLLVLAATSRQRASRDTIGVGDQVPAFSAPDENGDAVSSETYAGSPLLLKFFRGHW